jgi:hypothetical protein
MGCNKALGLINALRAAVGKSRLKHDVFLQSYAQSWADVLANHAHHLMYSPGPFDELLYWTEDSLNATPTCAAAVRHWYAKDREQLMYDSAHYIGFGVAYDSQRGGVFVCACLDPPRLRA